MTPLQVDALVTDVGPEGPYRRVRLHAPALAERLEPGQFVTALGVGGMSMDRALRQPLLPAALGREGLDLLLLSDRPAVVLAPDQEVNLLGPLGRPFRLPRPPTRFLLVADGRHLPALLPAVHRAVEAGCAVALLLFASAAPLYPLTRLPPELEVHVVAADGVAEIVASSLHENDVIARLLTWADRLLAATDPSLYPAMAEAVRMVRLEPGPEFAQALLLPTIVCGVGACQGCAVATRQGYRRACTDGPAFDLLGLETG
jgi:dihydroorotate dehydrogenase electron transfer subunit